MASVIAFRARHCIIDLTGFTIPESAVGGGVTIPSIYDTVTNLLSKNIIPVFKYKPGAKPLTAYESVINVTPAAISCVNLQIESDDMVYAMPSSGDDDEPLG